MKIIFTVVISALMADCMSQPAGTSGLPSVVWTNPVCSYHMKRPGWVTIGYPDELRSHGPALVHRLMKCLKRNSAQELERLDHRMHLDQAQARDPLTGELLEEPNIREELVMLTAQLAAEFKVSDAAPFLVGELEKLIPDKDSRVALCLITKLTELTGIENGEYYYLHWYQPKVQNNETLQTNAIIDLRRWIKTKEL